MEENKYYTPEIEEFHVGFTYEFGKDYLGQYLWTEFYIDHADVLSAWELEEQIDDGHVRVKYLDREDIESLGWVHDEDVFNVTIFTIPYNDPRKTYNEIQLRYAPLTNWILLTQYNNKKGVESEESVTRFSGRVKNKSELNKLMKMLQITK